ncbi:MAG: hypothetical protein ACREF4_22065 [Gammaproteobacteria bacterium]
MELLIRDRLGEPFVLGARGAEDQVQRGIVQRRTHCLLLIPEREP